MSFLARITGLTIALTVGAAPSFGQDSKPKGTGTPVESPPAAAVEYDTHSWKEFSDERGMFIIIFPGMPIEADNSSGETVGRKFTLKTSAFYFVGYQDFPASLTVELEKDAGLRKQFFDSAVERVVSQTTAKVLSEADVTIADHPGRFVKFGLSNGGVLRQHMYIVGKRTYQIFVITPKELMTVDGGHFDEMRATKFLQSFKLAGPNHNDGSKQ